MDCEAVKANSSSGGEIPILSHVTRGVLQEPTLEQNISAGGSAKRSGILRSIEPHFLNKNFLCRDRREGEYARGFEWNRNEFVKKEILKK